MKKIVTIVLAVVLIAGGLGSFAYVQAANDFPEVSAAFVTGWSYSVPGDNFTNHQVTGNKLWFSRLSSVPWVGPSGPVIDATLSLDSELTFDWVKPEPSIMGPQVYEWSFSNPAEGSFFWVAMVGFSPEATVTFIPGLDASRSVEPTVFSESADQTLTVKVTPQGEEFAGFGINIPVYEDDKVIAVPDINSVTGPGEAYWVETFPGEPMLMIVNDGVIGTEYTFTVTIEVTLKEGVSEVEFMPEVVVSDTGFTVLASGNVEGSSVNYTMPEVGTWTWSAAEGIYVWHWKEVIAKGITFPGCSREIPVPHEPMTGQKLVGQGIYLQLPPESEAPYEYAKSVFMFTNPDGVSEITIERVSVFRFDGTVVYEGPLLTAFGEGIWTGPMTPHETRAVDLEYYIPPGEPFFVYTVEVFWEGSHKRGLPLTGLVYDAFGKHDEAGNLEIHSGSATPMVNMEQELEPEDD